MEADVFVDGRDSLRCEVRHRHESQMKWDRAEMWSIGNDRWRARIPMSSLGLHRFVVRAKVDPFGTWTRDLELHADADQDLGAEFQVGARLLAEAATRSRGRDKLALSHLAETVGSCQDLDAAMPETARAWTSSESDAGADPRDVTVAQVIFSERLGRLMADLCGSGHASSQSLNILVDPAKARFSTWYEMFPRSASSDPGRHGTFADVRCQLDDIEQMGFDVLYLPPIHPIGHSGRKGRDGTLSPGPDDPGSPWAIGAREGGHRSVHPQLGTVEDFRSLVDDAAARGIDVAIDLAFQASPDHPWVIEHPEWFRHRPDGGIAHAENPPKSYEDIYPFDFDNKDWQSLWNELLEVVRFWIAQGVRVFRVDNPHTKPFSFWAWLLTTIRSEAPGTIFLSEAFTRPRVMEELAKIGFSQSYTYFTWRSSKHELETYFTELAHSEVADYFRPNLWPNTPDILTAGASDRRARWVLVTSCAGRHVEL